jgi:Trk K+ transport system NAD-binding subunit
MILGSVQRNRGLVSVLDEILTGRHGNSFQTHHVPARWDGWTVEQLHSDLFVKHRAVLVSVEQEGHTLVNPAPDTQVHTGERMVLLTGPDFSGL